MKLATRWNVPLASALILLAGGQVSFGQFGRGGGTPPQQPGSDDGAGQPASGDQADPRQGGQQGNGPRFDSPEMKLRMLRGMVSGNLGGMFGGRGGGRQSGGLDGIYSLLMSNVPLQEEIKLTEKQKEALQTLQEASQTSQREMFQQLTSNRGNNNGGQGGRGGRGRFDPQMMAQLQQSRVALANQTEVQLSKILTKAQITRLNQIRLRIIGPLAVAEPAVAQKLLISDVQMSQIQQVLDQLSQAEREQMQAQFAQFRGNRNQGQAAGQPGNPPQGQGNRNNGNSRPGQGDNAAANPPGGPPNPGQDANNQRPRFDPNGPEAQGMMDRMNDAMKSQDELRKKAEAAVGKILTSGQKSKFNKMLGPVFDITKLAEVLNVGGGGPGGGRGGRGGRGGN